MVHDVRLRPAEPADYDAIVAVMDDWWGRPVRAALPRLFLDHFHRTSIVAEHDGDLVGFLSPSAPEVAYIHFVGVDPRFRGRGLARRMYRRFFELARSDGRSVVQAITSPHNHGSIAFHTALGFTVTGPVPGYNGPSADRVVFRLDLDDPRPPANRG
ncbi:GNAT family N-acetyltransferase [Thermomonospora curvata]|uniref:GCN5-related N-acetyltransferase n=1 Tax=Thermomonospora curvata (strain ATCC 19995 / DSM 43183 / JCM 3096 / KCTC 9072 / NBRC 15933 / NCIMB 10081 / Henssen B9) TaxID=471852 RepID=D1A1K5_THECD|nr:GNAT family N-acetyltransferase [Thermomonospora curvata]ACY95927.1 GCN5-related N-acetyltransferase [Thermomonospora curvata DSM 43183]